MSSSRRWSATARLTPALALFALASAGCSGEIVPPPNGGGGGGDAQVALEEVATGLTAPTYLTAPAGDGRLFVLEQPGTIRIIEDGQVLQTPYLDLTGVVESGGNEQGLLGLAFHPDFADNGRFYVNFTIADPTVGGDTRVVEYTVPDPLADQANPTSADTLMKVGQPFSNHNGGMLAIGPDGMLYIALGDGGGAGDPNSNGQDSLNTLGSIARLAPDGSVPPDNPFVGRTGNDSIWAYGLRNPWRFAFDTVSGNLLIADVGQNDFEEVNAVDAGAAGLNYGWPITEGTSCFESANCNQSGLTPPVLVYAHDEGNSVTGGFVYRGSAVPGIQGRYFYSDFGSGFLRSFRLENGQVVDQVEHATDVGNVTSFGTGGDGELYVLLARGTVLRITGG